MSEQKDFGSCLREIGRIEEKICQEFHQRRPDFNSLLALASEGQSILKVWVHLELEAIKKEIGGLLSGDDLDLIGTAPQRIRNQSLEGLLEAGQLAQPAFKKAMKQLRKQAGITKLAMHMGPTKSSTRLHEKMIELQQQGKHACAVFDLNRATVCCRNASQWASVLLALSKCFGAPMKMRNKFKVDWKNIKEPPCLFYQIALRDVFDFMEPNQFWLVELQITTEEILLIKQHSHILYELTRAERFGLPDNCVACRSPGGHKKTSNSGDTLTSVPTFSFFAPTTPTSPTPVSPILTPTPTTPTSPNHTAIAPATSTSTFPAPATRSTIALGTIAIAALALTTIAPIAVAPTPDVPSYPLSPPPYSTCASISPISVSSSPGLLDFADVSLVDGNNAEEAARRKSKEAEMKAEEIRKKAEEMALERAEEARKKSDDAQKKAEEAQKRAEEIQKKAEETALEKAEEARKKFEEAQKKAEEIRQKAEAVALEKAEQARRTL